jgi:hypothetical protein
VLLRKSGVDSEHVGRHLTLHPTFRIGALFDEEVKGWDGSHQSVFCDDLVDRKLMFVGVFPPVNFLAAAFPGVGREHKRLVAKMPHLAFFGGMIHDEGGGQVRRWMSREPLVVYRMDKEDKKHLLDGMRICAQMAFEAGAREVMLPIFGMPTVKKKSDLDFLSEGKLHASRIECTAFHPLGSAKMSSVPERGVVKPTGETWSVENLFVCDGSILPTSIGVNSQVPIMSVAMMLARGIAADFGAYARRM